MSLANGDIDKVDRDLLAGIPEARFKNAPNWRGEVRGS
jgi:hypothetical protein